MWWHFKSFSPTGEELDREQYERLVFIIEFCDSIINNSAASAEEKKEANKRKNEAKKEMKKGVAYWKVWQW